MHALQQVQDFKEVFVKLKADNTEYQVIKKELDKTQSLLDAERIKKNVMFEENVATERGINTSRRQI